MAKKFVVAFNRDRDFYQVPIALSKAGKLERLITDFYTPDFMGKMSLFSKPFFKRRSTPHISSSQVSSTIRALILQFIIKLPFVGQARRYKLFKTLDRILSRKAGKIARKTGANLLLYSGYAKEAFLSTTGSETKRVLFVYHPHAELPEEILEKDFQSNPEIEWSRNLHHLESKLSDNARLTEEIKLADMVIAASSFTKRSVKHVFPNIKNIEVIPYGYRNDYLKIPLVDSDRTQCKFLFVGQGVQRKGLHHLLNAWESLALSNATLTLVCSVVDPGLKPLISRLGIIVLENISGEDLRNTFFDSDVFIMPSLVEGFGLVYLEAMSAGCYVIGTENTGLPDLGLTNEVGEIIKMVNVESVSNAISSSHEKWRDGNMDKRRIRDFISAFSWERFQESINRVLGSTPD